MEGGLWLKTMLTLHVCGGWAVVKNNTNITRLWRGGLWLKTILTLHVCGGWAVVENNANTTRLWRVGCG